MKYGLIVAVIVLAIGGYVLYSKSASPVPPAGVSPSVAADVKAKGTPFSGSVADLVVKNEPTRCVLTGEAAEAALHVASGKVRLDVSLKTEKQTIDKHVIFDGATLYAWDSLTPSGSKKEITFEQLKKEDPTFESKVVGYVCVPWAADSGVFVAPSSVTFVESK